MSTLRAIKYISPVFINLKEKPDFFVQVWVPRECIIRTAEVTLVGNRLVSPRTMTVRVVRRLSDPGTPIGLGYKQQFKGDLSNEIKTRWASPKLTLALFSSGRSYSAPAHAWFLVINSYCYTLIQWTTTILQPILESVLLLYLTEKDGQNLIARSSSLF